MNKQVLREVYLEKRQKLARLEWERRSDTIAEQFIKHVKLEGIRCIHVYLPMDDRNEPDVWRLVFRLRQEHPEICQCVSRTVWKDHSLLHYVLNGPEQLEMNKYGIPEPVSGEPVADEEIDMVLVPLVTFDRLGNRIGYGGGFYDRFLEKLRPDCKKIGYTLVVPLDEIPYIEDFDIPMDACIYPFGYLEF